MLHLYVADPSKQNGLEQQQANLARCPIALPDAMQELVNIDDRKIWVYKFEEG